MLRVTKRRYNVRELGEAKLGVELAQLPHSFASFHNPPGQGMACRRRTHGRRKVGLTSHRSFCPGGGLVVATGTKMSERGIVLKRECPRIERAQAHCDFYVFDRDIQIAEADLYPAAEAPSCSQVRVK